MVGTLLEVAIWAGLAIVAMIVVLFAGGWLAESLLEFALELVLIAGVVGVAAWLGISPAGAEILIIAAVSLRLLLVASRLH